MASLDVMASLRLVVQLKLIYSTFDIDFIDIKLTYFLDDREKLVKVQEEGDTKQEEMRNEIARLGALLNQHAWGGMKDLQIANLHAERDTAVMQNQQLRKEMQAAEDARDMMQNEYGPLKEERNRLLEACQAMEAEAIARYGGSSKSRNSGSFKSPNRNKFASSLAKEVYQYEGDKMQHELKDAKAEVSRLRNQMRDIRGGGSSDGSDTVFAG